GRPCRVLRQKGVAAADRQSSVPAPQANFPCGLVAAIIAAITRGGGSDMSELGADAMRGVSWPSNGLSEIPFRLYTDPEQYRLEQERIFKGPTWSFLCLATEIADPGDYIATTIGETAVVVTRDTAGKINDFVNRCAHRGNLLCFGRQGNVKAIQLFYHGWTYDLTGQLHGAPLQQRL